MMTRSSLDGCLVGREVDDILAAVKNKGLVRMDKLFLRIFLPSIDSFRGLER